MKVDGITLLQMIKNKEIKENTKIKEYYLDIPSKYILEVTGDNLIWNPGEFTVGELWDDDYTFEILQEKPTEIELLYYSFCWGVDNKNEIDTAFRNLSRIVFEQKDKINEISKRVNYLLKKEEEK